MSDLERMAIKVAEAMAAMTTDEGPARPGSFLYRFLNNDDELAAEAELLHFVIDLLGVSAEVAEDVLAHVDETLRFVGEVVTDLEEL